MPKTTQAKKVISKEKPKKIDSTLWFKLSKPLPKEAIQKTQGALTKKGYDTTGYGYQYLVNQFNRTLGIGHWNWKFEIIKEEKGTFRSGNSFWEITGKATIQVEGIVQHTEYGGHRAGNYADALKGASTNAFKKTSAFSGVGRQAFEGSIDDDNREVVGFDKDKTDKPKMMVLTFMEKMEKGLAKDTITFWESEIDNSNYTDIQKSIAHRKLEELTKKL